MNILCEGVADDMVEALGLADADVASMHIADRRCLMEELDSSNAIAAPATTMTTRVKSSRVAHRSGSVVILYCCCFSIKQPT